MQGSRVVTVAEALELAVERYQSGDLDGAATICRQIREVEPGNADALHLLGIVAQQTGHGASAEALIREAVALSPLRVDFLHDLASVLRAAGRLDAAAECLRRAVALRPDFAAAHHQLAMTLEMQGRLAEAVAGYEQALTLAPANVEARFNLGNVLRGLGREEDAVARHDRVLALAPGHAGAHHNRANALRAPGRLDEAAAGYANAVRCKPDSPDAQFSLGTTCEALGRLPEAVAAYRSALALAPNRPGVHFALGNALTALEQVEEAIASYRQALDLDPSLVAAHFNLGNAFLALRRAAEAADCYRSALALQPDHAAACANLGIACDLLRRPEDAEAWLRKSLLLQPERNDTTRHALAIVLEAEGGDTNCGAVLLTGDDHSAVMPYRVRIETASACNLRCQHCPTGLSYDRIDRGLLDMATFDKIVRQMQAMPTLAECVLYLGGEPLLNRNLALMCRRIKDETSVRHTHFTTNGMVLTERICRDLAASGVDKIYVSIDGRSPEENDSIRRGARYPTIRRNIRMLKEHLAHTDTTIVIGNVVIRRPGDPDTPVVSDFLLQDFPDIAVSTEYAMKWPGLDLDRSALEAVALESFAVRNFCSHPFRDMAVRANGDVVMCCYDIAAEQVMGNIHQAELAAIWNSEPYRAVRRGMMQRDRAAVPAVCRKCVIFSGHMIVRREF